MSKCPSPEVFANAGDTACLMHAADHRYPVYSALISLHPADITPAGFDEVRFLQHFSAVCLFGLLVTILVFIYWKSSNSKTSNYSTSKYSSGKNIFKTYFMI